MINSVRGRLQVLLGVVLIGISGILTTALAQTSFQVSTQRAQLPDSSELVERARDLQATFERRRRQMLPRFYMGTAERCLIVGRFCEWHANMGDYKVPDEGKDIRRARAELLRELEKLSSVIPGDDWIFGQRIRYLVEAHDSSLVSVARACRATKWWCDGLLGLALHVEGNFLAADSAFALALDGMPKYRHCHWIDVSPLLDDDIRKPYKKMSCSAREAADARIWWVSDPLMMIPGNERRTEHFARVLHTDLEEDGQNPYGLRWGGDLAELILRFGWAEKWTQAPPSSIYTGAQASVTGHEREPGFHFFLTQPPPDDIAQIADTLFELDQNPPREQYAPIYARGFVALDAQVARFRRGDSSLVVAAYDVSADTLLRNRKFAAALAASGDEALLPLVRKTDTAPSKNVMTMTTPWNSQLIGVELLAYDSTGAARWRAGFGEIPIDPARIAVSDLLFVDGGPSLPRDLNDAIARAHPGTKFRRDRKVGLFWELYGKAVADSILPVSLTLTPIDPGLLKRAFRALRILPTPTPLNIRWQENGASGLFSARSVLLDLSLVPSGRYSVKLQIGSDPTAVASRLIEVK
ncbi:MAG: hypothetical protein ABR582_16935 [Gemmatimonadaceae bacterium]